MRNYWLRVSKTIAFIGIIGCSANLPQGEVLYQRNCANCHMEQGEGLKGIIPPIEQSDYLRANMDILPCIIKHGLSSKITVNNTIYDDPMPGHPSLTDHEVINIINYINTKWKYEAPFLTPILYTHQLSLCDTLHKH